MVRLGHNERSWAIELITEINLALTRLNLSIKRAGGENTLFTGSGSLFPDLLLYSEGDSLLQGWELKMPDVDINDIELINNASKKAKLLNLNSFFLWNFTEGALYVLEDSEYILSHNWTNGISHIRTRRDVTTYKDDWKKVITEILVELNTLFLGGGIAASRVEFFLTQNLLSQIILDNKDLLSTHLENEANQNRIMKSTLNIWWNEAKLEYIADEANQYHAYAKVLLLNWINKFIFAHLIKRYHNPVMRVDEIQEDTTVDEAIQIFQDITNQSDFYNIFSPIDFSNKIPDQTWKYLVAFNIFLSTKNLDHLSQETLQTILEGTVQATKREINGQFTTPVVLADILARITIDDWNSNVMDPCSGTGTIVKAVIKNKIQNAHISAEQAYETTWISDKFSFPLQISNISLVNHESINIPSRIFKSNVFDLNIDMPIEVVNPANGEMINLELPPLDAIVSNLPFVAFEKSDSEDKIHKNLQIQTIFEHTGIRLSNRSDIYASIIISLWNELNENGRLGLVLSNSWLGVDWGDNFKKILTHYFKIETILISNHGRWFSNADVVTTLLILNKKEFSTPNLQDSITFGIVKKRISELEQDSTLVDNLVDSININNPISNNLLSLKSYSLGDTLRFDELGISWNALFYNMAWLDDILDKFVPLNTIFRIFRGSRRGWDDMFFPRTHEIEDSYIGKAILNSRAISSLTVEPDSDAFMCLDSIEDLELRGDSGALNWISRFETVRNGTGHYLPGVLDKSRNKTHENYWYSLSPAYSQADFITTLNPDRRIFVAKTLERCFINQRLIGLRTLTENYDKDLLFALLNSILFLLFIESSGFPRGLGALDLNTKKFNKIMILNPELISDDNKVLIKNSFSNLVNREIHTTIEELELEDRIEFDKLVLRVFGIEDYYDLIKQTLINMQTGRLSVLD